MASNTIAALRSSTARRTSNCWTLFEHYNPQQQQIRWGHTVRLITLEDLPNGKGYANEVVHVKAGYARNYLIPQKKALYATPQNFHRLGIPDPDLEAKTNKTKGSGGTADVDMDQDLDVRYLKEADILKRYLRNKVLKMWRVVDPNTTDVLFPGKVTALNIRQKLSKQLKIDLEDHETLQIVSKDPTNHSGLTNEMIQAMLRQKVTDLEESSNKDVPEVEITRLGDYVAMIGLNGGHVVPLKVVVLQRKP